MLALEAVGESDRMRDRKIAQTPGTRHFRRKPHAAHDDGSVDVHVHRESKTTEEFGLVNYYNDGDEDDFVVSNANSNEESLMFRQDSDEQSSDHRSDVEHPLGMGQNSLSPTSQTKEKNVNDYEMYSGSSSPTAGEPSTKTNTSSWKENYQIPAGVVASQELLVI